MKKKIFTCLFFLCVLTCLTTVAQTVNSQKSQHSHDSLSNFLNRYLVVSYSKGFLDGPPDTTTVWYDKYFGKRARQEVTDSLLQSRDFNPDYYRLFVPLTYYYAPFEQISTLNWTPKLLDNQPEYDYSLLPYDDYDFTSRERADQQVNAALLHIYTTDYMLTQTTEDQVMSRRVYREYHPDIPQKTRVINLFKPDPVEDEVGKASLKVFKPNWWTYGGSASLQLTQNYVSSNWYKGGESTNTMLSYLALKANYNDKEKVQWENLLEARFGITSAPSDTCHNFLVTNDLLRLYSKLGVQASSKWYYTVTGEFNTQFSNAYKKNTNTLQAAFLAPANLILSIGMDYKLNMKKLQLSLLLSPFAYNLRYVGNSKVDETAYGLKQGKDFLQIYGSKLTATWAWQLMPTLKWNSRLYYFTNYSKVEAEWENTFNLALNKFLSAQLFLHGRYDDSVIPTSGHSYFQLREYFSFGLSYNW